METEHNSYFHLSPRVHSYLLHLFITTSTVVFDSVTIINVCVAQDYRFVAHLFCEINWKCPYRLSREKSYWKNHITQDGFNDIIHLKISLI